MMQAQHLPPDEQLTLIASLWENVTANNSLALLPTPSQAAELDRRLADHLKNPADVTPWEEVRTIVLNHIKQ